MKVYGKATRATRRYFPVKLPVAFGGRARGVRLRGPRPRHRDRALHLGLYASRALARTPEPRPVRQAVAVARGRREIGRAREVMRGWAEASGTGEPDTGTQEEIARIERAIRGMDERWSKNWAGLVAALSGSSNSRTDPDPRLPRR